MAWRRAITVILGVVLAALVASSIHLEKERRETRTSIRPTPGPVVRGLQLVARLDLERLLLLFDVRNVTDEVIPYNGYFLGHKDLLGFQTRLAGSNTWQWLRIDLGHHMGIGPSGKDRTQVEARARIEPAPRGAFSVPTTLRGDTSFLDRVGEAFYAPLQSAEWPMRSDEVREVRVVLTLPEFPGCWSGEIPSAALVLDPADLPVGVRLRRTRRSP